MKFTADIVTQIWNDDTGEHIEIGPDRDGLGLIEIRFYTDDDKVSQSITMPHEQARLVIEALSRTAKAIKEEENAANESSLGTRNNAS